MSNRTQLWVALDVPSRGQALELVAELAPFVDVFKVGLELLHSEGTPQVAVAVREMGGRVFVDAKISDIPATVAGATKAIASLGVDYLNVHTSCGRESIRAAVQNRGASKVLGVTVLTSITPDECREIFGDTPFAKVPQFASFLLAEGADGVICSPQEAGLLRADPKFNSLFIATPGIRPTWAAAGDQKRITTPLQAVKVGVDAIIVGRPITQPPAHIGRPRDAALLIRQEMNGCAL